MDVERESLTRRGANVRFIAEKFNWSGKVDGKHAPIS